MFLLAKFHWFPYSNFGYMTYLSGNPTVGLPFAFSKSGEMENPNLELFSNSNGRYRRYDWDQYNVIDSPMYKKHVQENIGQCNTCHYELRQDLSFDADGKAFVIREGDNEADFYYQIPLNHECIQCHTRLNDKFCQ
jgi:hypothetical protein